MKIRPSRNGRWCRPLSLQPPIGQTALLTDFCGNGGRSGGHEMNAPFASTANTLGGRSCAKDEGICCQRRNVSRDRDQCRPVAQTTPRRPRMARDGSRKLPRPMNRNRSGLRYWIILSKGNDRRRGNRGLVSNHTPSQFIAGRLTVGSPRMTSVCRSIATNCR
jgi:hypothetical protein